MKSEHCDCLVEAADELLEALERVDVQAQIGDIEDFDAARLALRDAVVVHDRKTRS